MSTVAAYVRLPQSHTNSRACICKWSCSSFLPSPKFSTEQLTGKWHSLRLTITVKVVSHGKIRKLTVMLVLFLIFSFAHDSIFAANALTRFPSPACSQQKSIYLSISKEALMLSAVAAAPCPGRCSDPACPHSFTVHSSGFGSKEHPSFGEQRG